MRTISKLVGLTIASVMALGVQTASAQDKKVRIQMQSNFASTLALLGPNANYTVEQIKKLSGGSIDVKFFEPGALVPPASHSTRFRQGSLDAAWTTAGFLTGKDIAFAVYSTVPFGPGMGEYLAWMKHGGGEQLLQELTPSTTSRSVICHLIPPEASGWFRKEIKSLGDLKGLKMRFFGLGANVMQKLGVSTQLLQAGEIFQALQLGTIDATEFSMPVMDLSSASTRSPSSTTSRAGTSRRRSSTSSSTRRSGTRSRRQQKAQIEAACDQTVLNASADGEAVQPKAHEGDREQGRQDDDLVARIPGGVRERLERVVAEEQAAKSPEFKKAWDSLCQVPRGLRDLARHGLPEIAA